jgi:hypothetical protein
MTLPTAANQEKCDYCDKGDMELTKYDVLTVTIRVILNVIFYATLVNNILVDRK